MDDFGSLLKAARKRAKLSQEALAAKADIDDTYISKLELGTYAPPSREVVLRLTDALGITDKAVQLEFLLSAGRGSKDDIEGFELVPASSTPNYVARRRRSTLASPSTTTGQKIDAILEEEDLSEEEQETFNDIFIPHARQLARLIKKR